MSVWKKASKVNQKVHRERSQPQARKHLGPLEKHKDYKQRATNFSNKKSVLKALHKRALDKNPDEFYHHMINSKVEDGVHHERERKEEDTDEQIQLMQSQDLKYVNLKRTQERKKIERLQAQLHLSSVNQGIKNRHKYFEKKPITNQNEHLANVELPEVNVSALQQGNKYRKKAYMELAKRIEREKELSIIQEKLYIKKQILSKKNILKPTIVKKGTKDRAPIYKWKYERKS
ncbi:hypothetical protein RN001_006896 [Aquatica leii]|uniref:U3 small nucleolar RNA-associated protein 11 n=1 Tax=Aquatica leii TaxID=1421715 RepID=A0AAN7SIU5_9COLE|nr:hypothetical protein RN001_006896 [Aquatica leii]